MDWRRVILNCIRWLFACALATAFGVAVYAGRNWIAGTHDSVWVGAWIALLGLHFMSLIRYAQHRGWLRGTLRDPKKLAEIEERKQKLEADRQRMQSLVNTHRGL